MQSNGNTLLMLVLLVVQIACLCFVVESTTISVTNPGYYAEMDFGSQVSTVGPSLDIELPGTPKIFELTATYTSGEAPPITMTCYLKSQPTETFTAIDIDRNIYSSRNLILYSAVLNNTIDESDTIVVNLVTSARRLTISYGFVEMTDSFNATQSAKVVKNAQFFLGIITYPTMAVIVIVLIVGSLTYYLLKERKKGNNAALFEVSQKRLRALILLLFGLVLAIVGIGFVIVVPFFTKRDTQDVCCLYHKRVMSYSGTITPYVPTQSYSANCERTGYDKGKVTSFSMQCFGQEIFLVKYKANIWWWLIIVGTVPGIILYCVGHAIMTIAAYKGIRLLKPQGKSKGETKFSVAIAD